MVKINLLRTSGSDATNAQLVEYLSYVNFKLLLIGLFFLYVPDFILPDMWNDEKKIEEDKIATLTKEKGKLSQNAGKRRILIQEIENLKEQENMLYERLSTVKKILNKRSNPYDLYLYLIKNIPDKVWIDELTLDKSSLEIVGYADDWRTIQNFIDSLRKSVFIAGAVNYNKMENPKEVKSIKFKVKTRTQDL